MAEQQKKWSDFSTKEKTQAIVGIIVILFLLITLKGLIFGGSDEPGTNEAQSQVIESERPEQETDQAQSQATETLTPEKKIENTARTASTEGDGLADEVQEVRVIPEADGSYSINVKFYLKSGNKNVIEQTMANVYLELYKGDENISNVTVMATTELSNKYGDSKELIVYQTTLGKEKGEKINFEQDTALLQMRIIPGLWEVQKLDNAIN